MKVIVTLGTLFSPPTAPQRYEEHSRFEFDVSETTTIRDLIAMVDGASAPAHPGSSYLSLPSPHAALPEAATLAELHFTDGQLLRRFSMVRS
jgi:hypothetical protein